MFIEIGPMRPNHPCAVVFLKFGRLAENIIHMNSVQLLGCYSGKDATPSTTLRQGEGGGKILVIASAPVHNSHDVQDFDEVLSAC